MELFSAPCAVRTPLPRMRCARVNLKLATRRASSSKTHERQQYQFNSCINLPLLTALLWKLCRADSSGVKWQEDFTIITNFV